MSEWIDFAIYAVQSVLFWVLLPRQGWHFGGPMILDRNPGWLAANPAMSRYLKNSTRFLRIWYAWAAISIAVLLAVRLGWRPFGTTAPAWEALRGWNGLLTTVGAVGWFASVGLWFLWLKRNVPLADRRSATLLPRTTAAYVSLSWRVTIETLAVLHLAVWVVVGIVQPGLIPNHWEKFAGLAAMTVFFAVLAWLMPRRRPGYADRLFGEAYRRVEMRAMYLIRLTPIAAGVIAFSEALTGEDFARAGHLVLMVLVNVLISTFLFLRPVASTSASPRGPGGMIGSSFGSNMHRSPGAL